MKKILLFFTFTFITISIYSQTLGVAEVELTGHDLNHMNIEKHYNPEIGTNEFYISGTAFEKPSGIEIGVLIKTDWKGTILWSKTLKIPNINVRFLDIALNDVQEIAIVGYLNEIGTSTAKLSLFLFDKNGNTNTISLLDDTFDPQNSSIGTKVIYNSSSQEYIIGGFVSKNITNNASSFNGLIAKYSIGIGFTTIQLIGNTVPFGSITDIVEVSNGYFIVGNYGGYVLAAHLDYNLNLFFDYSFEHTNSEHYGASVTYNPNTNYIYVLSNTTSLHNPMINTINLNSNSHVSGELLDIGAGGQNDFFAGYTIEYIPSNNKLLLGGLSNVSILSPQITQNWAAIASLDANGNLLGTLDYLNLPNDGIHNYHLHGGILSEFLNYSNSPPTANFPKYYYQDIITWNEGNNMAYCNLP